MPRSCCEPLTPERRTDLIPFPAPPRSLGPGPGYDESVYLNALKIELDAEGVAYSAGHAFEVYFDEKVVGRTVADLWVADRFIVEVMARSGEIGSHERNALRAQLRAADVEL